MARDDSKDNEAALAVPAPVPIDTANANDNTEESADLVLFQVKECYVYLIPPRKSAASYRADEWDINKWNWEGALKVVSKGEQCSIRLEDKTTGELYAQALVREDYPLPVEAVIDSSRFFVLRIEDTSDSKKERHAFIGLGFRERPEAYDFQAALFDHVNYLNKKKEAQEMEQEYQSRPSMDYSIKEGETITLQLKTPKKGSGGIGAKYGKVGDIPSSMQEAARETIKHPSSLMRAASGIGQGVPILMPPPPSPISPVLGSTPPGSAQLSGPGSGELSGSGDLLGSGEFKLEPLPAKIPNVIKHEHEGPEEDFGDFQAA